jgi:hypothetical protein
MLRRCLQLAFAGLLLLIVHGPARADCVEEPRQVKLGESNNRQLKAYRCGTEPGQKGTQLRIEFHRLSPMAASLVVGQNASALVRATFGSPKVLRNEVFDHYADLLKQFGQTTDVPKPDDETQLGIAAADGTTVRDTLTGSKFRTLAHGSGQLPASDEIAALRKKAIPDGLKVFYAIQCQDDGADGANNPICKKYEPKDASVKFWRGLRAADVANYGQKIKDYNAQLAKYRAELRAARKQVGTERWPDTGVPTDLRLWNYVAGDNWPDDFVVVVGTVAPALNSCDEKMIANWTFSYYGRDILLDVMLVENTSTQPIKIGGLLGHRLAEPRLRVAAAPAASAPSSQLGDIAETLGPGEKLLVPTGITLVASQEAKDQFAYPQTAEDAYRRLGGSGYKGSPTAFGAPALRDYVFGPELAVAGVVVDGKRIDLTRPSARSANFFDLAMSGQVGSCPYLLSFDASDGDWTDHGKVLHRATGKPREETESRTFAGFRSRFRLEEREPELAHIDHAALHVTLASGETLVLNADQPELAARDGDYVRLYWGDVLELAFELPGGVSADDVVTSRLDVSGYYERYSALMARGEEPIRATLLRRMSAAAPRSACPLPAGGLAAVD